MDCCKGDGDPLKVKLEEVMPTHKTTEDTCADCFMVHSNGQLDCE